ncbi:alpha/beta hydrolase [Cellulomonas timonensis]|uniref:alpha/beta hydrolase n=1 Tax=Cellulomonas timonensis TaxID=1689271 RepID=UPI000A8A61BB|nr:alpha/beta-hydrolase family protein [Cellulomonas timonensis]
MSGLRARALAFLRAFSPLGLAGALVLFAATLGPSLIPRPPVFQGAAAGICAALGYGVGVFVAWAARRIGVPAPRSPRWRRAGWWALALAAVVTVPLALAESASWQREVRDMFGMPQPTSAHSFQVLGLAVLVALVLVLIARGLRAVARALGRLLGRWAPPVLGRAIAAVLIAVLTVLALDGVLSHWLIGGLRATYARVDRTTEPGVEQPTQPERSGSPASGASWESLGQQGRTFVSGGPGVDELQAFAQRTGLPLGVREPVRVYAGLEAGETLTDVAAQVVAELDRTGAWDREVLVVATTTGTGWVDPSMSEALELSWGGNTAIAAMQYSFVPSWVSFVSDRSTPPAAGTALFEAVHAAWSSRPEADRPLLMAFGESLGSYGGQGAFSGLQDMRARTDGALWVGTPSFTEDWAYLTDHRDPGSLEISPVVDGGRAVRWGTDVASVANIWELPGPWDQPRVLYVQHASDGVVWWSPDLLLHEPDWLREPRGPDVLPSVSWFPVATFFDVTIDLFLAQDVPDGHGHRYRLAYAGAWPAVAPPPGWTDEDTALLREVMARSSVDPAGSNATDAG